MRPSSLMPAPMPRMSPLPRSSADGPPAGRGELGQEALEPDPGAVVAVVEVMDDRQVVAREAEPQLALLVRPA